MTHQKVCLIVLDGWGYGKKDASDAVFTADTPFMDALEKRAACATLLTDGENVGLPAGQMGNSEVGHMNIGAGRVVYQDLVRINKAIEDRSFFNHEVLKTAMNSAKGRRLHLIGLVSNGGVHSSQEHLHALLDMAESEGVTNVFVHAFTDGRDCDPKSGLGFIQALEKHAAEKDNNTKVVSVIGRYYAMDRDKRWERVKKAYDLLTKGEGEAYLSASRAVEASYAAEVTDEFIEPKVITDIKGKPLATIQEDDVVICFNFRTDRCREITMALTQQDFPEHDMQKLQLEYYTMTRYDSTFKQVHVVYEKDDLAMTLGEVVAKAGRSQVRIAETEKYPHVTFFFSGGREQEFSGEDRILVHSPKVATYDLQPEMSAPKVADEITHRIQQDPPDLIVLNFANPDMVGHTGVFDAIVKAVEATDQQLKRVVEAGEKEGYSFVIIADHGNADMAINEDGSPNTAHTTNPVPVLVLHEGVAELNSGILADVAPTVLDMMGIDKPEQMTGKSLLG
jgi:2,3-bisphosphoglycerate-independent phosphoglycerate mutase